MINKSCFNKTLISLITILLPTFANDTLARQLCWAKLENNSNLIAMVQPMDNKDESKREIIRPGDTVEIGMPDKNNWACSNIIELNFATTDANGGIQGYNLFGIMEYYYAKNADNKFGGENVVLYRDFNHRDPKIGEVTLPSPDPDYSWKTIYRWKDTDEYWMCRIANGESEEKLIAYVSVKINKDFSFSFSCLH